jgi:hypothetical protein
MDNEQKTETIAEKEELNPTPVDHAMGEELTDEQLLQMAEGSCSWGANCKGS